MWWIDWENMLFPKEKENSVYVLQHNVRQWSATLWHVWWEKSRIKSWKNDIKMVHIYVCWQRNVVYDKIIHKYKFVLSIYD